jgi:hypothetical protein
MKAEEKLKVLNLEIQKFEKEMEELGNSYKSKIEVEDEFKVKLEPKEKPEEQYITQLKKIEVEKNKLITKLN